MTRKWFAWLQSWCRRTCMRLRTLSCRTLGGLYLGRMERTRTPSTKSCDATSTWNRCPQFFTQASRTCMTEIIVYDETEVKHFQVLYKSEMFKHWLTVRANMISLKFLFPTILFLIALTASLALEEGGRWYDIPRKKCPDLFCLDFLLFKCSTTIIRYKYNYRKQWCKHINNTKQGEC